MGDVLGRIYNKTGDYFINEGQYSIQISYFMDYPNY